MKKVLFAAGDPGGARALLPLAAICSRLATPFLVLDNGTLSKEADCRWPRFIIKEAEKFSGIEKALEAEDIGAVVFATSVEDLLPLTLARVAKAGDIPVIHVLDNWTNYRARLEIDGLPMLEPDIYSVMDEIALQGAQNDGIDSRLLRVTGQPALSNLLQTYKEFYARSSVVDRKKHQLVFVSEPVRKDQGDSPSSPAYRGYTEQTILKLVCDKLQPYAETIELQILPHPREDEEDVFHFWQRYRGDLRGGIATGTTGKGLVFAADGVIGMSSILLYEAWLFGRPVLSLQPELKVSALRMLEERPGVIFVDRLALVDEGITRFLKQVLASKGMNAPRQEIERHAVAPEVIHALVLSYL